MSLFSKSIQLICFSILLGTYCHAQFSTKKEITNSITNTNEIRCYDLDGDGDEDILLATTVTHSIVWYENLGNNVFSTLKVITDDITDVRSICAADLNGDGLLEIIYADFQENIVAWYRNLGGGQFSNRNILTNSANGANSVFAGDIDGDGDIDILGTAYNQFTIFWFQNWGLNTFSPVKFISSQQFGPTSAEAADFDGDGDLDIIATSWYDANLAWYENLGLLQFSSKRVLSNTYFRALHCHAADMDGDQDMDIVAGFSTQTLPGFNIKWYENDGTGLFTSSSNILWDQQINKIRSGELSGDTLVDFLITDSENGNSFSWFRNMGNGTFAQEHPIAIPDPTSYGRSQNSDIGDIDSDGNNDVILSFPQSRERMGFSKNLGAGVFDSMTVVNDYLDFPSFADAADLDNDGDIDIVASGVSHVIKWFENDGQNQFSSAGLIIDTISNPRVLRAEDMDADGDNDIVIGSQAGLHILENNGTGNFLQVHTLVEIGTGVLDVIVEDINLDGINDILINPTYTDTLQWYISTGNINSWQKINLLRNHANIHSTYAIHLDDFDGDNDIDVLESIRNPDEIILYENTGSGQYSTGITLVSIYRALDLKSADLDGDGLKDLVTSTPAQNVVEWHRNMGNNTFDSVQTIYNGLWLGFSDYELSTHDFDQDGDIDIISQYRLASPSIIFHENIGGGKFSNPENVDNIAQGTQSTVIRDIDLDGALDILGTYRNSSEVFWHRNLLLLPYSLTGNVFYDNNVDGVKDSNETYLDFVKLKIAPQGDISYRYSEGKFVFKVDSGSYNLTYELSDSIWNRTTDSSSYNVHMTPTNLIADSLDFGFYPAEVFTSVACDVTGGLPRCNSNVPYTLSIQNRGSTQPNIVVELTLDNKLNLITSSVPFDSSSAKTYYWIINNLSYSTIRFRLQIRMTAAAQQGNTVTSLMKVYTVDSTGVLSLQSDDRIDQTIVCSFDPNDKSVEPQGTGPEGYIANSQRLEYLVRFQNTGNDTALNISIVDQFHPLLDAQTFRPISSSHPVKIQILNKDQVTARFTFDDIYLPDSNVNEPESHGFIKYSIKPKPNLLGNTQIFNTAHIYFDFNPPIETNTTLNTIECPVLIKPTVTFQQPILQANYNSAVSYQWLYNDSLIPGAQSDTLTPTWYGLYSVMITDSNNCSAISLAFPYFTVGLNENATNDIIVHPIPSSNQIHFDLHNFVNCDKYNFKMMDVMGKAVREKTLSDRIFSIQRNSLPNGVYFYVISCNGNEHFGKIIFE